MFTNYRSLAIATLSVTLLLSACEAEERTGAATVGRWYSTEQVDRGQLVFQTHCASCHGERAQGLAADWRKTDAEGNYPPPPLDGSAHAWHHPMVVLEKTIVEGGLALGGVMPGFSSTLDENDVLASIAYFQSLWTDEIYTRWQEINER